MAHARPAQSLLLQLPDPCLLTVLQFCAADDHRNLFNAARAHSRLHQAAELALRNITVTGLHQSQAHSMLKFLTEHGQHVDSVDLTGVERADDDSMRPQQVFLCQLPQNFQLRSLQMSTMEIQLQASNSCQGVLGAAAKVAALKQLGINSCCILDEMPTEALSAALSQLPPELEHLSMSYLTPNDASYDVKFPVAVLQQLQHLTYLELAGIDLQGPDEASAPLQPLQALTRLVELRLDFSDVQHRTEFDKPDLTTSMLSGAQHLTCLQVAGIWFDSGILVGNTQLQHLDMPSCQWRTAGALEQFLFQLPQLQHLTHLNLAGSLYTMYISDEQYPPATAYSGLTGNSNLQHLDISRCTLPAGVWQHVFPDGRQRPLLQSLDIAKIKQTTYSRRMHAPEGSRLVSCCRGLQSLNMHGLLLSNGFSSSQLLLAPLQELSGLHTLHLTARGHTADGAAKVVCQLTGLRELGWHTPRTRSEGLLQLTCLRQLTALTFFGRFNGEPEVEVILTSEDESDYEPVWRLILQHQLQHDDPRVVWAAEQELAE